MYNRETMGETENEKMREEGEGRRGRGGTGIQVYCAINETYPYKSYQC